MRPRLRDAEIALLESARQAMADVDDCLAHTRFRAGISRAFALAQETNRYLDARAPWQSIKTDRARRCPLFEYRDTGAQLPQGGPVALPAIHQSESPRIPGL